MELYTIEELSRTCENCGQKLANLFKNRADMMQWIAWLNQPEKPAGQSGKCGAPEKAPLVPTPSPFANPKAVRCATSP
jgi:hypothetical protein